MTPQQNGVEERKNRTIQEMARTILNDCKLSYITWALAIHSAIHILIRGQIRTCSSMTPYELQKRRPTTIKHFRIFGSKCYIKRNDENLGKFDFITNEGIFLVYVTRSKAYKCYNLILNKRVEIPNVKVDEELKYRKIDDDDDQPIFKQP